MLNFKIKLLPLLALGTLILGASSVRADVIVYATELNNSKIVTVNTTTNVVTDFHLTPGGPDSLILAPSGNFIYDINDPIISQVRVFNPVANTDTLLAGPAQGINSPQDMVLDPTMTFVLVSNFLGNTITKTNITTGATTVLANIQRPEGLAFDSAGNLYVLAGGFGGVAHLFQIDPTTGAVLKTSAAFDPTNSLDGLVWDPFSKRLYANSQGDNAVYSIDPSTFVAVRVANVPSPDGLITDTHGLLYIASRDFHIYRYNISTGAVTQLTQVPGLDDLGAIALSPPGITKSFGAAQVVVGATTPLTIVINNPNSSDVTGVNFIDTLSPLIAVAAPPGVVGTCGGGTITAVAGAPTISLAGATLAANTSCLFSVNVVGISPGPLTNCVTVGTGNAGTGNQSCATLTVVNVPPPPPPPVVTKSFGAAAIAQGANTTMTINISNPAGVGAIPLTALTFTDTFPAGLTGVSLVSSNCGGTTAVTAGAVTLTSGGLAVGGVCTIVANVTGAAPGTLVNSVIVRDLVANLTSNTSTASLGVIAAPRISKSFGVTMLPFNGTTTLSFQVSNPNAALALDGVAFTDALPAGLLVASPNGLVGSCGGGTITATAGTNTISLTGATLPAAASCSFQVNVTSNAPGTLVNVTGPVTSTNGGTGNTATATVTVLQLIDCDDCFQVKYASNLNVGDSVVDLTNTGTLTDPNALTQSGNMCVNVYTFDPSEEMISCCSCLVTPNGLNSLSVRSDLISNTLTLGSPTSVIIKLVSTIPLGRGANNTGGTCNPSSPIPGNLAPGMKAWGTTLHALPTTPVSYGLTETEFERSLLSVSELTKLSTFCGFIQSNGSGFGICKSCRTGGLGGDGK